MATAEKVDITRLQGLTPLLGGAVATLVTDSIDADATATVQVSDREVSSKSKILAMVIAQGAVTNLVLIGATPLDGAIDFLLQNLSGGTNAGDTLQIFYVVL